MVETHSIKGRTLIVAVVLTVAVLVFSGCSSTSSDPDEPTTSAIEPTVETRSTESPERTETPSPTETSRPTTQAPTSIPQVAPTTSSVSQPEPQSTDTPGPAMTDDEPKSTPEAPATEAPTVIAPVATEPPLINTPVPVTNAAPDFALPSVQGPEYTLSQFREDKSVAVVFYRGYW